MTQKYESEFHKRYVGGVGEVDLGDIPKSKVEIVVQSYEEILDHYRKYVGNPEAELPEAILRELRIQGKLPV